MNKIKLVIFDVNETLFHFKEIEKRFLTIGLEKNMCSLWFSNILKEGFSLSCTNHFHPFRKISKTQLKGILQKSNIKNTNEKIKYILDGFNNLKAHKDVKKSFEILKKKKKILTTLTNGHSRVTKLLLKNNGLEKYIDKCFSVDDVKKWKPSAEPYLNVVNFFKLKKKEVIMIAAHSWDISGAKNAGLITGYISKFEGSFINYYKKPDFYGKNLEDLAKKIS